MKILKALREEMRAFNLDTDEELDLEALQDIDLDALLGDGYADAGDDVQPLDFITIYRDWETRKAIVTGKQGKLS